MIWRWFWREWRTPSLLIVWLALTLAVASVLALSRVSDRLDQNIQQQGRAALSADRVLRSPQSIPDAWLNEARKLGLSVSTQLSFMTMTYAGDTPHLAMVKATDSLYPQYGELITRPAHQRASVGQVLVAPALMNTLNLHVGDKLDVGDTSLIISAELLEEPDSGFNPFQMAPSIIISLEDVAKTGAIQPGSRLTYRYLFAGDDISLKQFTDWLKPQLNEKQRWDSIASGTDTLSKTVQRAQQFLLLSALLTLLLAVAALTIATSHYCRSRYERIAILKTLGAGHHQLRQLIIGQWLILLLFAALTGTLLGLATEAILLHILAPVLPPNLPSPGNWPWLWTLSTLIFTSLFSGIRPYINLLATPPQRVLRSDHIHQRWPLPIFLPISALFLLVLLWILLGNQPILWGVLGGLLLLAATLAVVGWSLLWLLQHISLPILSLRLAVKRLLRQPWITLSQLAAFALSFMLLALLLVMQGNLLQRWQQQLPADTPNYFVLNIAPSQLEAITQFLQQHQIESTTFYPVVRARLIKLNQQNAHDRIQPDSSAMEAINRELNLTWLTQLPEQNKIVAGNWPPKPGEVSIEQGLAKRLGVGLGDHLTFSGDTQTFEAKISSLRQVNWESLRPNFYFIFPPNALNSQPQTWLTSFHSSDNSPLATQLNRQFPTLTLLNVNSLIEQISRVLQQISRALEVIVVLVTGCGILLLLAQIQIGLQQRKQELQIYRTLGASTTLLRQTLWYEFSLLGIVAGITATIGAETALWALQHYVFDFPWQPNITLWWALPLSSTLLLGACGVMLGARLIGHQNVWRNRMD